MDPKQGNQTTIEDFVKAHDGTRIIKKILIANNGMAATKAILSMRQWAFMELGNEKVLEFVVMASSDDLKANAEFIRLANAYVEVPPGKNTNNYANVELIVEVAKKQAVDAVWPGWGHASEKPELPRALLEAGITFLGPNAPVMHALGDKIASTILAQSSGVPCIPWNGEGITAEIQADGSIPQDPFERACLKSCEDALSHAHRIGYPVVLKASEGGGGKGIRKCQNDEELKLGWTQVTTEVAGSPVFMMQLCVGARHLEVQLVGDDYGQVVALIGRDCSTQRRFQKIFEEGPPTIAPKESFRKAEQAAQRLAMSVKYRGAGTVEYLYKPETDSFYFLELNPRLQVEHPVTEGITNVNVPALQLLIGMGVPLNRCPDIRKFYGLADLHGPSKIDFIETPYVYPNAHVIAARVTAENPDDGFRPTSGKIERVRFQSSPAAWGYFSVGTNGAIHEFADSQFGHIFAKGPTREDARKALQLALQQVHIAGEIRNPVEYLVELADTKEFRENTIDTAWLDRLIAEKSVKTKFHERDAIFYAACFRAHTQVKEQTTKMLEALKRGHLPLRNDLRLIQSFTVEVAYDSTKYVWQVHRTKEDEFAFTIGEATLEARIREQPDRSLYIKSGDRVTQVSGIEEPLGLRLRIEGTATITFPRVRDPSELRSDFNGKLVRYLHADGDDVTEGEAFVELEAMKMIMSLRATASGKIKHALGAGAIVGAGQMLATLDLKDPSSVQTIKPFTGKFELSSGPDALGRSSSAKVTKRETASTVLDLSLDQKFDAIASCLNGFCISPGLGASTTKVVQGIFPPEGDAEAMDIATAMKTCRRLLDIFIKNEQFFAGLVGGNETQIKAKFDGDAEELLSLLIAHDMLSETTKIICALLRGLSSEQGLGTLGGAQLSSDLTASLEELVKLNPAGGYSEVNLLASQMLDLGRMKPLNDRRDEVRTMLLGTSRKDLATLSNVSPTPGTAFFGLDLVSMCFKDDDTTLRTKALEVYIRRLYRGYCIDEFEILDATPKESMPFTNFSACWKFCPPGAKVAKQGYALVLPDLDAYDALKKSWVLPNMTTIEYVHILVAEAPRPEMKDSLLHEKAMENYISSTADLIAAVSGRLETYGCVSVHVLLAQDGVRPTYLHYTKANSWKEVVGHRNLRSSFPTLMELNTLSKEFSMTKLLATRRSCVMLGAAKDKKTETILLRTIAYQNLGFEQFDQNLVQLLVEAFDLIDRVLLNASLDQKKLESRIFLHIIHPIEKSTERDINNFRVLFKLAMDSFTAHGSTLLKLRIATVQVKIWIGSGEKKIPLLLMASQDDGWVATAYNEQIDNESGCPLAWSDVDTGFERQTSMLTPAPQQSLLEKRQKARKDGSTYIFDFLSLFRIALTQQWFGMPEKDRPEQSFHAEELVLSGDSLKQVHRPAGENQIGMIAWLCSLKTPEYPNGREMVLIGNDVTFRAGSFGTQEDDLFQKASALAREKGIPRIYIACNSGARLGTVEELKKLVHICWNDSADPNKGFEYLYLTPEELAKLPAGSVSTHEVNANGAVRHVLDAIMGLNLPSTKGGIGVENLQGSGLIAGETSRAYEETFTLSYVTGRSVGIGAYLNRLGQRNIQMVKGPMILTGFQALNKLLGQQVYTTQDQLGGPHIMVPNGVTHELVQDDISGVYAILRWLSFVPSTVAALPPMISPLDPIQREIQFIPTKAPYDPRHMLAGTFVDGEFQRGFCDEGSFHEYMEGWGKTVVVGRGRLGGLPVGIVAVETRSVMRHIPADPADATSHDIQEAQAGQVWFPDSAFKTAQAIRDFNRGENLPLIIFANWRGFSGGTRDMFAEVLKYGAMIVDALVDYKHPVTIYIPPNGELRGGAWVVLDPKINPDQMEMFADKEARGGILEPPAAAEIVFKRDDHVLEMMRRCDASLKKLNEEYTSNQSPDTLKAIKAREKLLLPMYRQVSVMYCDLHDRSERMKGLGAIHEELTWRQSRAYLHWRIRRRVQENGATKQLRTVVTNMSHAEAKQVVNSLIEGSGVSANDDQAVATWFESHRADIEARVEEERQKAAEEKISELLGTLPISRQEDIVRDLVGYTKVLARKGGGKGGYSR